MDARVAARRAARQPAVAPPGSPVPSTRATSTTETPKGSLGLRAKLSRVYALQVLLISIAALVGVFLTYLIVENVLTQQALNLESEHYWSLYIADSDHPLPTTANLRGYLVRGDDIGDTPEALLGVGPGYQRIAALPGTPLVHTSDRDISGVAHRLHLVFSEAQVSELVFYFGLAPLVAVLLTVYALLFLTFRLSHRAISPMLSLASYLARFDFRSNTHLEIPEAGAELDSDTRSMLNALNLFSERLERYVDRERQFTRDAGHELRTPLAVLKSNLDLLASKPERSDSEIAIHERMSRVVRSMETLLTTLLLLAREHDLTGVEPVDVNLVVAEQVDALQMLAETNNNRLLFEEHGDCQVTAPEQIVGVVITNLLRNALTYTRNGDVRIDLYRNRISVADTGVGMSDQEVDNAFSTFFRGERARANGEGYGLGLAIVKRICNQFGWSVSIDSSEGEGTTFTVEFPAASA